MSSYINMINERILHFNQLLYKVMHTDISQMYDYEIHSLALSYKYYKEIIDFLEDMKKVLQDKIDIAPHKMVKIE